MNLAKKGTVLLAALSVFAMTSCGPKEQKLDYDAAKEWVSKNYTNKEDRKVTHTQIDWDYSKTIGEDDETTKTGRSYVIAALKGQFAETFTDEEYAKVTFNKKVEGAHGIGAHGEDMMEPINGYNFDDEFGDLKEIGGNFVLRGKELIVSATTTQDTKFAILDRYDTKTYNSDGYLKEWKTSFDKKDQLLGQKKITYHLDIVLVPIYK